MPAPIAMWNPARGAWETAETNLLCGHSVLYSETWPTSGSMRNGRSYPPPTPERRTGASASSSSRGLLPTPMAHLAENGGSQPPAKRRAGGHTPTLADEIEHLLPTPDTGHSLTGHGPRGGRPGNGHQSGNGLEATLTTLLPTPAAHDSANTPENHLRKKPGRSQVTSLQIIAEYGLIETGGMLLPTPSVALATGGQRSRSGDRKGEPLLGGIAALLSDGDLTDQQ